MRTFVYFSHVCTVLPTVKPGVYPTALAAVDELDEGDNDLTAFSAVEKMKTKLHFLL